MEVEADLKKSIEGYLILTEIRNYFEIRHKQTTQTYQIIQTLGNSCVP